MTYQPKPAPLVLPASWYRTVIRIAQRIALEKAKAEAAQSPSKESA